MSVARHRRFNVFRLALLTALPLLLAACATSRPAPRSLYGWGNYPSQVYSYLGDGSISPAQQIETLEADKEKIRSEGAALPPGYMAHLGLLYAAVGNDAKSMAAFEAERTLFPEFEPYLQFLKTKGAPK